MPRLLNLNDLVESLVPLVIPMIWDRAQVSHPIPGHNHRAGVRITFERHEVELPPEQYETLRVDVLQYFQNRIFNNGLMSTLGEQHLKGLITSRLREVFADA